MAVRDVAVSTAFVEPEHSKRYPQQMYLPTGVAAAIQVRAHWSTILRTEQLLETEQDKLGRSNSILATFTLAARGCCLSCRTRDASSIIRPDILIGTVDHGSFSPLWCRTTIDTSLRPQAQALLGTDPARPNTQPSCRLKKRPAAGHITGWFPAQMTLNRMSADLRPCRHRNRDSLFFVEAHSPACDTLNAYVCTTLMYTLELFRLISLAHRLDFRLPPSNGR